MPDLTGPLQALVEEGAIFASARPEATAQGGFWRPRSGVIRPRSLPDPTTVRHAAVLVLLWEDQEGAKLLLTERSAALPKHPGQISFPGGAAEHFDAGPVGTALRESQEEVGLDPRRVQVIGQLPPALIPVSGFSVTPVVAVAEDLGVLSPHAGEVERVIHAPVSDLIEPRHRYTAVIQREGIRLPTPAFYFGEGTAEATFVWGFTGILLDQILDRVGWAYSWDPARELDPRSFRRHPRR